MEILMMDVLFWCACATAFFFFCAPIFACLCAQSVLKYSPYAYLFTLVSSVLWVLYAIDWHLEPLRVLNGIGAFLSAIYCSVFLLRSDKADLRCTYLLRWTIGGAVLLAGVIAIDLLVGKNMVYGIVCCAASCFASAAPFYNLPRVREEKTMNPMPSIFVPALALPNGILWTVRNTNLGDGKAVDYNLVIASGFAAFCALVQLAMHFGFWFWRRQPPPTGIKEPLIKNEDGARDGEHEDQDTDRDDVRSDGYEQDSKGSSQGQLGDPEDEHRVHVASSSDDEVVVDAAAAVAQLLPAAAGELVQLPPAFEFDIKVAQSLPAAAGEVIQLPPVVAAEVVEPPPAEQQPEVHHVPADAAV